MSELMKMDKNYLLWIQDISNRFKRSQIKAATYVNREMLLFYWGIGADIVEKKMTSGYGSNFYNNLSNDLKDILPDVKSFSPRNLRYMADFYEMYKDIENLQQVVAKCESENLQQVVANSDAGMIFRIPWGHHIQILTKCKGNRDKALYFVRQTLKNNWSRAVLMNFLDTELYERDGKAITNFEKLLPGVGTDLANELTKDPYNFDFLTMRAGYDEKELKDALMNNIQSFLLELGKGFAFVGREYRLVVGQTEQFIDMLFYNIQKHCYVVIEIKTNNDIIILWRYSMKIYLLDNAIDYSKCIGLYCSLYSVAQGHKENFIKLNGIRNKLTHLGIKSQEEYYILAGRIADILNYVHYNIIMKIEYLPTKLENICLEIFNIESVLSNLEESIWRIANETRIEEICNNIISYSKCEEIQKYLQEKKILANFGSTFDADYVYSIYTMKRDDNVDTEICSIYGSVQNNALFISDSDLNDGPVFAILPLSDLNSKQPRFYISNDKNGTNIPEFQGQSDFWKKKPYSTHFSSVPYGKNKIIEMLKKIINYIFSIYHHQNPPG